MSLIGALNTSKTALATHQAVIQVASNNIANAGNADYTRQVAKTVPTKDYELRPGVFVGTGITIDRIQRQIDEALQTRLRGSFSDGAAADTTQQWLGRIEAVFNELSDEDLSTQLSQFFNSWSNLANKPQDVGLRQVVLQNGDSVAKWMQNLRTQLGELQHDIDQRIAAQVIDADQLAQKIADLNGQIVVSEGGTGGMANGLRDQRDALLGQLSQLIDIRTVETDGQINVYVGSEPLVIGTQNRGVGLRQEVIDGELTSTVIFKENNGAMRLQTGQLGALMEVRTNQVETVIDDIDSLAKNLIFELNKIHASGQGLEGYSSINAGNAVDDTTVALNSADSGLDHAAVNGSFVVHVKQKSTGLVTSTLVQVDLDGLNADDTTLDSLRADLDAIADISASISGGKLQLSADSGNVEISFSQDSSGALAALGINTFFNGSSARDIEVSQVLRDRPTLLAAAKNGESGDNQTARAIAGLESMSLASLGNSTLKESYQAMVNTVAVAASTAKTNAEAAAVVTETLTAQREALSGVSMDEEAINLMKSQRAFQGAARVVAAIDELMQTVLGMV